LLRGSQVSYWPRLPGLIERRVGYVVLSWAFRIEAGGREGMRR
jgi:hypothetical protein